MGKPRDFMNAPSLSGKSFDQDAPPDQISYRYRPKTKDQDWVKAQAKALGSLGYFLGKKIDGSPYVIHAYVSKGSFGALFRGYHEKTKQPVAIKLESMNADRPQLHLEFGFYRQLGQRRGIPNIYFIGPIYNHTALVMDLLGPNLSMMMKKCGGRFSLRTTIQLTIQFISLISYFHGCGLLYRDTKPENFLLGLENSNRWWVVHIVDLGFCKQWRLEDGSHIPFQEGKFLTGTVRYISINNHKGYEQSRRDDMEAIGYLLIYLHKGHLPWMNIQANNIREKYIQIGIMKQTIDLLTLCDNMPVEYVEYMDHVISLKFEQEPDYTRLGRKFVKLLATRYGLELNDKVYDWNRSHSIKDPLLRIF